MCGDFMPFYKDGTFYLFYLYKNCVYAVETSDFVSFGEPYLVLQNGSPDDQTGISERAAFLSTTGYFTSIIPVSVKETQGKKEKTYRSSCGRSAGI